MLLLSQPTRISKAQCSLKSLVSTKHEHQGALVSNRSKPIEDSNLTYRFPALSSCRVRISPISTAHCSGSPDPKSSLPSIILSNCTRMFEEQNNKPSKGGGLSVRYTTKRYALHNRRPIPLLSKKRLQISHSPDRAIPHTSCHPGTCKECLCAANSG